MEPAALEAGDIACGYKWVITIHILKLKLKIIIIQIHNVSLSIIDALSENSDPAAKNAFAEAVCCTYGNAEHHKQ